MIETLHHSVRLLVKVVRVSAAPTESRYRMHRLLVMISPEWNWPRGLWMRRFEAHSVSRDVAEGVQDAIPTA
ncbi:hypothetical protein A5791_04115 [Mycobacterium sp. 852002-51163_SCH5372311]|nr:hypothetical protein A5791_04115 [Mycobacterium sp. 852002-51163_SCH5372311]